MNELHPWFVLAACAKCSGDVVLERTNGGGHYKCIHCGDAESRIFALLDKLPFAQSLLSEGIEVSRDAPMEGAAAPAGEWMRDRDADRGAGVYFNSETAEIYALMESRIDPGESWFKFSDDCRLGLLAARRELLEQRLIDDPITVSWYATTTGDVHERLRLRRLVSAFREDVQSSRVEAEDRGNTIARLLKKVVKILRRGSAEHAS